METMTINYSTCPSVCRLVVIEQKQFNFKINRLKFSMICQDICGNADNIMVNGRLFVRLYWSLKW